MTTNNLFLDKIQSLRKSKEPISSEGFPLMYGAFLSMLQSDKHQICKDRFFADSDEICMAGLMKAVINKSTNTNFGGTTYATQFKHLDECGALIREQWNGQDIIIIGCGTTYLGAGIDCEYPYGPHDHSQEYTVGMNPTFNPHMVFKVGTSLMAKAFPIEAYDQIQKIVFEGLMTEENHCLQSDALLLLKEGGQVIDYLPVLTKKNGKLFTMNDGNIGEEWIPWYESQDENDLGQDIFNWKRHLKKVAGEEEDGFWDHPDDTKTWIDVLMETRGLTV